MLIALTTRFLCPMDGIAVIESQSTEVGSKLILYSEIITVCGNS
jgi:hypothetical protein